jgi:hypothetical protein
MKFSVITKNLSAVAVVCLAIGFFLPKAALATPEECTSAGGGCFNGAPFCPTEKPDKLNIDCGQSKLVCCTKSALQVCQGPCKESCNNQGGEFEDPKATNCPANQKCCITATIIPDGGPCTESTPDSNEITLTTTIASTTAIARKGSCKAACIGDEKPVSSLDCLEITPTCCVKPDAAGTTAAPKATKGSPTTLTNELGEGATLFTVINRVIKAFLGMVGALALAVFVYAGVLWMTAGSSDRVKDARSAMKNAVIGLALIGFSYVITTFFINALTGAGGGASKPATQDYATPAPQNPDL